MPIYPEIDEECDRILSLVGSGQLLAGEKQMRKLLRKYPDYHTVLYGMGVCHVLQEQLKKPSSFLKRLWQSFPYLTEAHLNMGMAYIKLEDIAGVVSALREVIRIGGSQELVWINGPFAIERTDGHYSFNSLDLPGEKITKIKGD